MDNQVTSEMYRSMRETDDTVEETDVPGLILFRGLSVRWSCAQCTLGTQRKTILSTLDGE